MKISLSSLLVVVLASEATVAQNWVPGWTSSWFSKAGMSQISQLILIFAASVLELDRHPTAHQNVAGR